MKAFWRNIGASESEKRQWIHVFNSCFEKHKDDARCFRMANGVLSKRSKDEFTENSINIAPDIKLIKKDTEFGAVWQIPAVLTRQGVQNGFFKDAEELKETAWSSNMIPVTDGHPRDENGSFVSSRTNIEFIRGFISEGHFDEKDATVKGIVNIFDNIRNNKLIEDIQSRQKIDGSIGFYTDEFHTNGEFNGQKFEGLELNIIYDHFAILENGHGACSQEQGCGLGLNKKKNEDITISATISTVVSDGQDTSSINIPSIISVEPIPIKKPTLEDKKNIVINQLKEFGFEDSDIKEIDIDYDALYYMLDCNECSGSQDLYDSAVWGDVSYTFTPSWSQVDKSKLPASAFMVVRDSEKKSTWKLPYKTSGGTIHCGAIRAIRQVLAGARGGVQLSSEERSKAKSLSDRHWAACQRIRERGNDENYVKQNIKEKVLYIQDNINELINMADTDVKTPDPAPTEVKSDGVKVLSDAIDSLTKEKEVLMQKVNDLESAVKKYTEEKTLAEHKIVEELRKKVLQFNIVHRVYTDDQLLKMDASNLEIAERVLGYLAGTKTDLRDPRPRRPAITPAGFAPLTIGDLSKKAKKGE